MHAIRKKKLINIIIMLVGISISFALVLYALRQNISLYFTPTQLSQQKISAQQLIRIGGFVAKNSVHYFSNITRVKFVVTDYHNKITVVYNGLLPSLFRVGQGVVVQGYLQKDGVFDADQVLAKHDANYRPPRLIGQSTTP